MKLYKLTDIMWIDAIILWVELHTERQILQRKMKLNRNKH